MSDTAPKRALLVVAKRPAPGRTKTRLTPPLTAEQASALYECFLQDTLDLMRRVRDEIAVEPMIAYLPEGEEAYFRALAPDFGLLLQQGADLSERLHHATQHCLTHGYNQAVIMDSDSPTLPAAHIVQAFTGLDTADVTLGPCDDGGYYCIGLKAPAEPLFINVTMSTEHVFTDTLEQARLAKLSVAQLPACYDVDYASELKRLATELETLPEHIAAHTRQYLSTHRANLADL